MEHKHKCNISAREIITLMYVTVGALCERLRYYFDRFIFQYFYCLSISVLGTGNNYHACKFDNRLLTQRVIKTGRSFRLYR